MSDLPSWVAVEFDVEHELAEAMYPNRYRAAYRAVWDARDRIALVGKLLSFSAGVMAAHSLVQTAVTASETLNAVPVLWGAGVIGWTWAARALWTTSRRIEEVVP
ncbi:hypothetical protein HOU25_gp40 [Corynebacterium phage Juicebox]|uniref:Uncharacterized protein n=1 Tax=Corynebacterium phage Juicebox TaxID=2301600 RepID=A0A385UHW8_9CAUD|nr:hypothetical protein HOU25_gp40 [Corynebacterium phage Juicebox]AYB69469.1 hypothetical protein JUICEBOX_40 [Corynebacterium phage Juicebox]